MKQNEENKTINVVVNGWEVEATIVDNFYNTTDWVIIEYKIDGEPYQNFYNEKTEEVFEKSWSEDWKGFSEIDVRTKALGDDKLDEFVFVGLYLMEMGDYPNKSLGYPSKCEFDANDVDWLPFDLKSMDIVNLGAPLDLPPEEFLGDRKGGSIEYYNCRSHGETAILRREKIHDRRNRTYYDEWKLLY